MNKPYVIEAELRAIIDVDETLIETGRSMTRFMDNGPACSTISQIHPSISLVTSYHDEYKVIVPKNPTISFLKSLKSRGYHITVQSNNGWRWAQSVVHALELQEYVDVICTKPSKCVDDAKNPLHIIGSLIHPEELK